MDPSYLMDYTAKVRCLNDEARTFDDPRAMQFGLLCVIGDEGGPLQVGAIRDYGEGLAILYHRYRGGTWTRVYTRTIPGGMDREETPGSADDLNPSDSGVQC